MNKQTFKRYAFSSLITFLTGFGLFLLTNLESITLESIKDGSIAGVVFMAFRAGIKALLEYLLNSKNK